MTITRTPVEAPHAALLGVLLAALSAVSLPAEENVLRYLQVHGTRSWIAEYGIDHNAEGIRVTSEGSGRSEESFWVPGRGTVAWRQTDSAAGSDLRAERTGDIIRVTGRVKGKEVTREVRIDPAPWYQIFGPGINDLLPSDAAQMEFWVVNPDDLAPHKMLARRAGTERLEIAGARVDAFKIHFSPAGALAIFWGADFWYRPADSAYLFSRLPENGGLTTTTIEQ